MLPVLGQQEPPTVRSQPQPRLVKVEADHGWTLTHPWYFDKRWQCQAGTHPAPPGRVCKGPFGAWLGSVQGLCDHTLFIFLVSVPRDLLVT